jgi:hypothetical protein
MGIVKHSKRGYATLGKFEHERTQQQIMNGVEPKSWNCKTRVKAINLK